MKKFFEICVFCLLTVVSAQAQIVGEIVDAQDGYAIPYASASYKGHHVAISSNGEGKFSIERHEGWILTFSSVGYIPQMIKVDANTNNIKIELKPEAQKLEEVVINSKRGRYSRKNNPAVDLMRRVIAQKKRTDLANHNYYQFNKYQKITLSLNDVKQDELEKGAFKNKWMVDQVEVSPFNSKLTLPISVDETVTQHVYRKDPLSEKDIIKGQQSQGVNNLLQTGDILNVALKEVFQDVDLYNDNVRLLQYPFTSPIGETAISFYRYYIIDTVYVDRDLCYHLHFLPNNQQDFGFRGDLFVLADSTLHLKKCSLTIPHKSDVNFVQTMHLDQEFSKLENGEWVLTKDDMWAELKLASYIRDVLVVRNTRLSDYAFDELPRQLFKGRAKIRHDADALLRDEAFWNQYRAVELTKSESSMNAFVHRLEQSNNFKWIIFAIRAFAENYVETGSTLTKSKFDFGPINTMVSSNFVDGYRLRLSGRTMAALNPHLFWDGFIARGLSSKKTYYDSQITYSLNRKKNSPFEFPQQNFVFETTYDVMSPADKFLIHNKDNAFMTFRTQDVQQMYFLNRQKLSFNYETDWGFSMNSSIKVEEDEVAGDLHFMPMSQAEEVKKIRTTELSFGIRYCPGQTFINTKQHRLPINLDSPEFTLSHTMGFKNFLGGGYKLNYTEIGFYKRQWIGSWGYVDFHLNGGAQWNKVPFPLLLMPPVNLTYFEYEGTFGLMNNMEFLSDRFAFGSIAWDANGKIFNRIPLIKHLKWREYFAIKGMWSTLTNKNNPTLSQNAGDQILFQLPKGSYVMDHKKPYMEMVVGVHNIFKFFGVDYVRRLSYYEHPNSNKWGIRFTFMLSF